MNKKPAGVEGIVSRVSDWTRTVSNGLVQFLNRQIGSDRWIRVGFIVAVTLLLLLLNFSPLLIN